MNLFESFLLGAAWALHLRGPFTVAGDAAYALVWNALRDPRIGDELRSVCETGWGSRSMWRSARVAARGCA